MIAVTRVWYHEAGRSRVIATITPTSSYKNFKAPSDLTIKENRHICALRIIQGWRDMAKMNGKFTIVEGYM